MLTPSLITTVPHIEIPPYPEIPPFPISDHATSGYFDVGNMRMAWGKADSRSKDQVFLFSGAFAVAPTVTVTSHAPAIRLAPTLVTGSGFSIHRTEFSNPIPFSYMAFGLKPDAVGAVPSTSFDVQRLPIWSAAVRAQRSGQRNARILCLGDSTTAGFGANASSAVTNDRANSYPTHLANVIAGKGYPANWCSWIGNGNTPQFSTYDYRITFGTGWGLSNQDTPQSVGYTVGGFALRTGTVVGQTKLNFDTTTAVDTVEIYTMMRAPGTSSNQPAFVVSVDDIDTTSIVVAYDTSNPGGLMKTTISVPRGRRKISIRASGTTDNIYCIGMVGYDSAVKEVTVLNGGWGGSKATDWNSLQARAWSPLQAIPVINPDLCILNLGINDSISNHPLNGLPPTQGDAYMRDMQAIIDAVRSSGSDIMLVMPNQIGFELAGYLDRFYPYMQELADRNALPVMDIRQVLGSTFDIAYNAGYIRDRAHPNSAGYLKIAQALANVIMPS